MKSAEIREQTALMLEWNRIRSSRHAHTILNFNDVTACRIVKNQPFSVAPAKGQFDDDVILLQLPESFSLLFIVQIRAIVFKPQWDWQI